MYIKIQETAAWLKDKMPNRPNTAIILGTGLAHLADDIQKECVIPYNEIPNFPVSTVEGHNGRLIFGKLGGKDIMAMEGRFHYYEGYSTAEISKMLSSSEAAVRTQLHRGRELLKNNLLEAENV